MSMPAQRPAPRTATTPVADEAPEPVVQVRAEHRARAPGARPSRACARPRGRRRPRAGCRRRSSRARPGWSTPSTSRSPTTAETGTMPPPSALPSRYRSGTTPTRSHANVAPTRPSPDWISSAMNSTLRSRVSARTRGQEVGGRHDDAGLALDRLDEHRDGVLVDRGLERGGVAVRHRCGSRACTGPKSSRASRVVAEQMIVVVRPWKLPAMTTMFAASGGHALHPVAPGARDLDGRLDGLGAGVHRQHHVLAAERGELGRRTGRAGRCGTRGW